MLTWRIHTRLLTDNSERIKAALDALTGFGDQIQFVSGNPLETETPLPVHPQETGGVALTTINEAKSGVGGNWQFPRLLYFDTHKYNVSYWLPRIGESVPVLNRQCTFVPCGCIRNINPPLPEKLFIRPDSGLKTFTGFVLDCRAEDLSGWEDVEAKIRQEVPALSPESIVCISAAQYLEATEWRFWIADRKVVASTPYSWGDQLLLWTPPPAAALDIANMVAENKWQPDVVYVADVVQTKGGRFWLNELNAASTSGLYNVPMSDLLPAIRETVLREIAGEIGQEG